MMTSIGTWWPEIALRSKLRLMKTTPIIGYEKLCNLSRLSCWNYTQATRFWDVAPHTNRKSFRYLFDNFLAILIRWYHVHLKNIGNISSMTFFRRLWVIKSRYIGQQVELHFTTSLTSGLPPSGFHPTVWTKTLFGACLIFLWLFGPFKLAQNTWVESVIFDWIIFSVSLRAEVAEYLRFPF